MIDKRHYYSQLIPMINPLALTYEQLLQQFRERYDRGAYHAAAFYRAFYQTFEFKIKTVDAFCQSPRLIQQVTTDLDYQLPEIIQKSEQDGVTKLAFQLADKKVVETVIIPMPRHTTVCISCQVGCRMGCKLCETGRMGLVRNLSAAEIVSQIHAVKARLGMNVRNVVFMGMGEPLDNFDNVAQAIDVISDQRGLNIAKRRITLSTSGLVDGIERLAGLGWPQLKLAVSLNAADDSTRSRLMPINRRYDMATLKKALLNYPLARGNVLLMEYVLIKHLNDTNDDARQLSEYLSDLPVRLNLIAYNSGREPSFEPPNQLDIDRFRRELIHHNVFVRLRRSKGAGIMAACGQLGANANGVGTSTEFMLH